MVVRICLFIIQRSSQAEDFQRWLTDKLLNSRSARVLKAHVLWVSSDFNKACSGLRVKWGSDWLKAPLLALRPNTHWIVSNTVVVISCWKIVTSKELRCHALPAKLAILLAWVSNIALHLCATLKPTGATAKHWIFLNPLSRTTWSSLKNIGSSADRSHWDEDSCWKKRPAKTDRWTRHNYLLITSRETI